MTLITLHFQLLYMYISLTNTIIQGNRASSGRFVRRSSCRKSWCRMFLITEPPTADVHTHLAWSTNHLRALFILCTLTWQSPRTAPPELLVAQVVKMIGPPWGESCRRGGLLTRNCVKTSCIKTRLKVEGRSGIFLPRSNNWYCYGQTLYMALLQIWDGLPWKTVDLDMFMEGV